MKRSMSAKAIRRCSRVASRPSARRQARCGHNPGVTAVSPTRAGTKWGGGPTRPHLAEGDGDGGGDAGRGVGVGEVLQEDAVALQQDVGLARQSRGARRPPLRHRVPQLPAVRRHLREGTRRGSTGLGDVRLVPQPAPALAPCPRRRARAAPSSRHRGAACGRRRRAAPAGRRSGRPRPPSACRPGWPGSAAASPRR